MSWLAEVIALKTLLWLAPLIGLAVVAWFAHLAYWKRRLSTAVPYALCETLPTPDGSRIELRRVSPPCQSSLPPILLVHGIATNHRLLDPHSSNSLARHLVGLGRDVWLLTLRSGLRLGCWRRRRSRFANMLRYDVPLGIKTVLSYTKQSCLDYVGFSMGGMLLYGSLGRVVPQSSIRRAVMIGAPGAILPPIPVPGFLRWIPRWWVPRIPFRVLALAGAFHAEWLSTPLHRLILNPKNMGRGMTRLAMVNVIADIPGPLHADFLEWASRDGVVRVGGEPILEGLAKVSVPALFIAGSADRIAPPESLRRAHQAWGSAISFADKRYLELGSSPGTAADYGHGDLALGAEIAQDLFGIVSEFLQAPSVETAPRAEKDQPPRRQDAKRSGAGSEVWKPGCD